MREVLSVKNLVKDYQMPHAQENTVHVLKGLEFSVLENEFVGIMGKSGCGKTTLLKILGLIHMPTSGELIFKDKNVNRLWEDECADIRRREIGFVFQDFYLMDSLTVEENIMLPMILDKAKEKDCYENAKRYVSNFQIEYLVRKYPYELSGGERQRVAICRALMNDPDLILADEPTGNLDSRSSVQVIDTLTHINQKYGKTILMVTHDSMMASYCSRIILLKDGKILDTLKNKGDREAFYQEITGRMAEL